MEISAKVLREVEFSGSLRGYNTDEVDEFLEQAAVAVDRLQADTRLAAERAETDRAGRDRTGIEDEESIRRTLVLAQRTADLAIKEAQEEAALLLDQTRAEAETVITEAHQTAERLATDAEQELRDEVARLTALRESLQTESDNLVSLLETERARLTESLSTALQYVERTLTPPAAAITPGLAANPFAAAGSDAYHDAGCKDGLSLYTADAPPDAGADDRRPEMAQAVGANGSLSGSPGGSSGDEPQLDDLEANIAEDAAIAGGPAGRPAPGQYDWASVARARSGALAVEDPGEHDVVGLTGLPSVEEQQDTGRRRPFRRKVDL